MTCLSLPSTPESIPHWDIKLSTGVMFFFSNGPHRTNGRYTLLELINDGMSVNTQVFYNQCSHKLKSEGVN